MTLEEAARRGYKRWGIMTHTGEVISGQDKPDAHTHSDLNKKVSAKYRHATVEYAHSEDGKDLMIRTSSRDGLLTAMKHWKKLPGGHDTVSHDHCDNLEDVKSYTDGPERPERALLKINKILKLY